MEKNLQLKYDIVLITWEDSIADDIHWKSIVSVLDWSEDLSSTAYSTGFLLDKDDNYVVLALSIMPLGEDVGEKDINTHGILRIPTTSILDIKILRNKQNN